MKCPWCDREMKQGVIQCRDGVFWSEKKRPVAALGILGGDTLRLDDGGDLSVFGGCCAEAFLCRECGKIILNTEK